jgi:hypothetical protein
MTERFHQSSPLRVEIGVLSLPGVSAPRARAIGRSVQAELARLLSSEAVQHELRNAAAGTIARLDAGRLTALASERPERAGARIAARLARSLLGLAAEPTGARSLK